MNRSAFECVTALVVLAASAAGLVESLGFRNQGAIMPVTVTALASALSAIWLATSAVAVVRGTGKRVELDGRKVARFSVLCFAAVAYVYLMSRIGFFTTTILVVPALAFIGGYRNAKVLVAATIGFVVVLYGVFRGLLSVPLPDDLLLSLIGG
ncbi:tripartite tricarboxylate transporter TctB family protein [Tranquillimonas alkanivorans]|nr:tripartite tricarboxylate transporter TctB family protein [Tranquillimonas alkanivorans]